MKIIVMSDSHGNRKMINEILHRNPDAFAFLHAGDLEDDPAYYPDFYFVRGNNDYSTDMAEEAVLRFGNVGIYMVHSQKLYYDRVKKIADKAKQHNCQIAVYGHTHCVDDQMVNGIRILNPGSLYYNRDRHPLGYFEIFIDENTEHYSVNRIDL